MTRIRPLTVLLISIQFAGSSAIAESNSPRILRVERGLRPAIVLDGISPQQFPLEERMRFYKTPGVSVAVINNGAIAWARGYGAHTAGTTELVTAETLFQAASISKPIAAMAALRLVEQGKLDLDEDINHKLRSWKLPENEFTTQQKISLRLLLSHRSGLTDNAGFRRAAANRPLPTLQEILETGKWTPAPIRVGYRPGDHFQYSGGGYCIVEQLLEDVSGESFPTLVRKLVLEPLHMAHSSFDQHLPTDHSSRAAAGHEWNGKPLPQRWNLYPATSAAGLWTTPSDLARFAIELQKYPSGGTVLSRSMLTEMLSTQGPRNDRDSKVIAAREEIAERPPPSWGLGVGLVGSPPTRFFHTGSNPGYQCELQAYLNGGQGAVVMSNGAQGWRLGREILWAIANEYDWPDYDYRPAIKKVLPLSPPELDRFVGRYRISSSPPPRQPLRITRDGDHLFLQIYDDAHQVPLHPESSDTCFTIEDALTLRFLKVESGKYDEVTADAGWRATRESAK